MEKSWQLPRRTFLRGLGTAMALPLLEAMAPSAKLLAATLEKTGRPAYPARMAFVYVPNGANMADWTPKTTGADYELPMILEPLNAHKNDFSVLSNLTHDKARANGDGGGDHARASATFLTGCQARKTDGADIHVGVSVDQVAAQKIGRFTRLPSLEIGCERGGQTGNCDSGYSCAYSFNISWKGASTPMPSEINPRAVFDRLFSSVDKDEPPAVRAQREQNHRSVLDFVLEDAGDLKRSLGYTDRRKLDEYMSSVRELEQRIQQGEKFAAAQPDYAKPTGIPKDYEAHIRLMYDLLALSFQTDSTRISSFIVAHDGSNKAYPFIGIGDGHHDLSHHQGDMAKKAKIAKINRFHMTQFAYFLEKLKSMKEGDGNILDHSMIVYGSGIADGNAHAHDNLPVLLAGKACSGVEPGQHIRYARETPMCNLYLSMLDRMDASAPRLGDSTGPLKKLS